MASTYRSMRGKAVDMNRLLNQNEMTIAVGNMKINARGDALGPGGKVIPNEYAVNPTHHIPAEIRKQAAVLESVTEQAIPSATSSLVTEPVTAASSVLVSDTTVTIDKKTSKKQSDSEIA
jgi:hypothetical protein